MAINLLGLLKDQMTDGVLEQMAGLAGADKAATGSAMGAILPTILGSVLKQGSTSNGAGALLDMLKSGNHDGSMLDNLGSVLGGGSASDGLMSAGKGILSTLLGSRQSGVLDLLGQVTGLSRGSNTSLMGMAAPMVMGMIGKYVKNKALDAVGLGSFLGTQKSGIMSALPAGMDKILGFANTGATSTATKAASSASTTRSTPEPEKKGGWLKWLVLGLLGLGIVGFLMSRGGGDVVDNVKDGASGIANTATNTVGNAAGAATAAAGNAAAGARDAAGNVVGAAKDAAGNVVAGAKDAAGNVAGAAGNAVANAKDAAGNVAGAATNAAKDAAGAVSGAATSAATSAQKMVTNEAGAMKGTFEKMFKKEAGAPSSYSLSQIKWNPENHKIENFSKAEVMGLAAALKANPSSKIRVQVHTSEGKNAIQNKTIASARASVVEKMLIALGVGKGQISAKGVTKDAAKSAANVVEVLVD